MFDGRLAWHPSYGHGAAAPDRDLHRRGHARDGGRAAAAWPPAVPAPPGGRAVPLLLRPPRALPLSPPLFCSSLLFPAVLGKVRRPLEKIRYGTFILCLSPLPLFGLPFLLCLSSCLPPSSPCPCLWWWTFIVVGPPSVHVQKSVVRIGGKVFRRRSSGCGSSLRRRTLRLYWHARSSSMKSFSSVGRSRSSNRRSDRSRAGSAWRCRSVRGRKRFDR